MYNDRKKIFLQGIQNKKTNVTSLHFCLKLHNQNFRTEHVLNKNPKQNTRNQHCRPQKTPLFYPHPTYVTPRNTQHNIETSFPPSIQIIIRILILNLIPSNIRTLKINIYKTQQKSTKTIP